MKPDIYAFDYDSKPTQPKDCGAMSDKEIEARRIRVMESDAFGVEVLDIINDELTYAQAGVIGYYVGMKDYVSLGQYLVEILGDRVEKTIAAMEVT